MPVTGTGVEDANPVVAGSPSWPSLLRPQHCSVPLGKRAQEWKAPPLTAPTPLSPTTATGVGLGVSGGLLIVPPPSWP